jgi:hypothetical protein
MKSPFTLLRSAAFGALVCLIALAYLAAPPASAARGDKDWKPVDPAEIKLSAPVVEKDADAEALFWEVKVAHEGGDGTNPRTALQHYVRIKIYTERGRESQSRVDILAPNFFGSETKISDIAGRTIKPDGTVVELKKEDIFERTVVKMSGIKVKAKSFALPGVEPGSIIEYRWREVRGDTVSQYDRLEFARDIPVVQVRYLIKPRSVEGFPFGMRVQTFNGDNTPFQKEGDYYSTTMSKVPAFREEPHMPPEYSVRPWMLVYYTRDHKLDAEGFWKAYGRAVYESAKPEMKAGDEVKRKAAEVVGDAATPEQKIERLFQFCRTQIKNVYDDANGMTAAQRDNARENKSPSDTLKRGMGTGLDIDMLFAALAIASGLDARLVYLADRSDTFFDPSFADTYFLRAYDIAVKVGDGWRFYDPASTYVPFGMLRWQEEGQQALLSDPKEPTFVVTPLSGPEKSLEKRVGAFKLSEDGTLEGDVRIEYTGHLAADLKEYNDDDSPAEREETLREKFRARFGGGVELTDIKVENVNDPVKPFVYSFRVRIPGYAQRTGKRLFLQPAFFQKGRGPLFPTAARRHEVYFHYPWSEEDRVQIKLPEGYALDSADSPASVNGGELTKYQPEAGVTKDGRTLVYTRKFYFGKEGGQLLLFPVTTYPQLKNYFDKVSKEDAHTLALKQGAAAAAPE